MSNLSNETNLFGGWEVKKESIILKDLELFMVNSLSSMLI